MKFRWNRTMLNLCGIVEAILKMAAGRNMLMSGINSGHHNLPTYEMSLKSNNVEFVRHCGSAQIQHCSISTKFHMYVDYDDLNLFPTSKNFYRSPFSTWLPQYRTNSTLPDFNDISYVGRFIWCPEFIPNIEKFLVVAIFKNGCQRPFWKWRPLEFFQCRE
jgi:hypothetical protein